MTRDRSAWRRLLVAGSLGEALEAVDRWMATGDDVAQARLARCRLLHAWGRDAEASMTLGDDLVGHCAGADDARDLAEVAGQAGRFDDALRFWHRAVQLDPQDPRNSLGLCFASLAAGSREKCLEILGHLTSTDRPDLPTCRGIAAIQVATEQFAKAEAFLRGALTRFPGDTELVEILAVALERQDRYAESLAAYDEAIRGATGDRRDDLAIGRAMVLSHAGNTREGAQALIRELPSDPLWRGHAELGPALMSLGEFEEGFRQAEHRWWLPPLSELRAAFGLPQWMGQPLAGRTILVRAEQGIGDFFQYGRYLGELKARGARVLFLPARGLVEVAARMPGVDRVLAEYEAFDSVDYYANLLSLPLAFDTRPDTIPSRTPYFAPLSERVERWRPRLSTGKVLRVGIAWAGAPGHRRDRHRSLRLEQLSPVLEVPGVAFFGLQKGPAAVQAECVPEAIDWTNLGPESEDLDDAAAILAQLDLLICVDTALAHLAGAMGRPAWVLIYEPADYRWLVGRDDSPWYPSLRLFRQERPGDWEPVIRQVGHALADRVAGVESPAPPERRAPSRQAALDAADRIGMEDLARAAETRSGFIQHFASEPYVGRSLDYYGEWIQPILDLELRLTRHAGTVLEIGAGVGCHSIQLARSIGPRGALLAWDRRERHRRALRQNLLAHRLFNTSAVVGDVWRERRNSGEPAVEAVDTLRLSQLSLLKINAGVDPAAILATTEGTLWRCRPMVSISAFPGRLDAAGAGATLRGYGYRTWHLACPLFRPDNFNRREDDVFGGECADALIAIPEELDVRDLPGGLVELR